MMEEKIEVFAVTNDWSWLLKKLEAVEDSDVALYKVTPKGSYYYSKEQKETAPNGKIRLVRFLSPEQAKKFDGGMAEKIASQAAEMEDKLSVPIPDMAQFEKNIQPCMERHRKICATIGANSALAMESCKKASDMKAAIARNLANFPTVSS